MGTSESNHYDSAIGNKYNTPFARHLRELTSPPEAASELREYLGITNQALNQYKSGVSYPKVENLIKIATFFGVSLDWLIGQPGAVQTLDANVAAAAKFTGLAENVVEVLHEKSSSASSILDMPMLDYLLASPKFWEIVRCFVIYQTSCQAMQSRPALIDKAETPEDIRRYKEDLKKATEDKDLFLFQIQKHLFSIAADIEGGCRK
jgi:transcriptional regulator with XRE-family HTH domain